MINNINEWIRNNSIKAFLILSCVFSWILWAPSIASSRGFLPFQLPAISSVIGNFGPALAAIFVSWSIDGKGGVKELLKPLFQLKGKVKWYIIAFIPILLNILLIGIYSVLSNNKPELNIQSVLIFLPTFIFWLIVGGPLGEEIGWRGFALPRLLKNNSYMKATLILCIVWFVWHLPRYLDPRLAMGGMAAIIVFGVQIVVFSILFTWLYKITNGGLLFVIIFHASINSVEYMMNIAFPTLTPEKLGPYFITINLVYLSVFLIWSIVIGINLYRNDCKTKSECQ